MPMLVFIIFLKHGNISLLWGLLSGYPGYPGTQYLILLFPFLPPGLLGLERASKLSLQSLDEPC
jgi:hypothetical protein